ncbi:hypothetical protein [Brevundimonas sp.]|uniref:hypothetical protein n=1 Tax=Brevundimonas sp. TaxID=1871086 RepID=UPI0035AF4D72
MRRRDLIAASAVLPAGLLAGDALAGEDAPTGPAPLSIAGVGLPVITEGRIRNYVFVSLRLHLGAGATAEALRVKEPYFRDALVRAAYRTPFTVANNWTVVDGAAVAASLMRAATTIAGRGKVARVEIVSQTPRRRTGVRAG